MFSGLLIIFFDVDCSLSLFYQFQGILMEVLIVFFNFFVECGCKFVFL